MEQQPAYKRVGEEHCKMDPFVAPYSQKKFADFNIGSGKIVEATEEKHCQIDKHQCG